MQVFSLLNLEVITGSPSMVLDGRYPEYHHHHHHAHHHAHSHKGAGGCCGGRVSLECCCSPPSALTTLGVCLLVLAYTLLGACTFMALEARADSHRPLVLGDEVRARTVEKLWSITEDLNILYKENWTRLAAQEVLKFQDTLVRNLRTSAAAKTSGHTAQHRWSFSSSFLYSLTLITTIGYGSVSPRTPWGKVITIVYALIGIPLMLVYLSTVGDALARNFRRLYARLCGRHSSASANISPPSKNVNSIAADGKIPRDDLSKLDRTSVVVLDCGSDAIGAGSGASAAPVHLTKNPMAQIDNVRIPVSLCLFIIIVYICGGALLFNRLENWSFLEGSYFCFTSLGTIGFGDLIPGLQHNSQTQSNPAAEAISVFVSSAYILIGMALIAMCFNLAQDEVVIMVRKLGKYFGMAMSGKNGGEDDEMMGEMDGEGIAMSVVSSQGTPS